MRLLWRSLPRGCPHGRRKAPDGRKNSRGGGGEARQSPAQIPLRILFTLLFFLRYLRSAKSTAMAMIEVDFDVFKALTAKRPTETVTYNDVLRELLRLGPAHSDSAARQLRDCVFDGIGFPEGTQFRKTYKGQTYTAEIKNGRWIGTDGKPRKSPSDAAVSITKNNVNGWRFWECKRPSDMDWQLMDNLRRKAA
jgi:hypothetical protein